MGYEEEGSEEERVERAKGLVFEDAVLVRHTFSPPNRIC